MVSVLSQEFKDGDVDWESESQPAQDSALAVGVFLVNLFSNFTREVTCFVGLNSS